MKTSGKIRSFMLSVLLIICFHAGFSHAQNPLDAKFVSCTGLLSLNYPSSWTVLEQKPILRFGDSAASLSGRNVTPLYHRLLIEVNWQPNSFRETIETPKIFTEIGRMDIPSLELIESTFDGKPALFAEFSREQDGVELSGFFLNVSLEQDPTYTLNLYILAESVAEYYDYYSALVYDVLHTLTYESPVNQDETKFFTDQCEFSIMYPVGWIQVERSGQTLLFNSESAKEARYSRQPFGDDQLEIEVVEPRLLQDILGDELELETITPEEILHTYLIQHAYDPLDDVFAIETEEYTTIGSYFGNDETKGLVIVFDFGDQYALIAARSSPDGLAEFEDQVLEIANSLHYQPVESLTR